MISNAKGFTIVEIIVALAIITIVVIASVSLFSHSIFGIYTAGHISEELFDAQGEMEEAILTNIVSEEEEEDMPIPFPGVSEEDEIIIKGKMLEIVYSYGERFIALQYFMPKQ